MESFNILSIVVGILNIVVGIYFFRFSLFNEKASTKMDYLAFGWRRVCD